MDTARTLFLLVATISMGMTAGVFDTYRHAVMPGLAKTDDRTFVGAFQAIDRAIVNPWFMVFGFFGALGLTAVAAALQIGRAPLPWVLAALVLYLVTVVLTIAVNVPRNNRIKAAGDPDRIDVDAVRAAFGEAVWRRSNAVRVVLNTAAFGCLAWALVLHGRT